MALTKDQRADRRALVEVMLDVADYAADFLQKEDEYREAVKDLRNPISDSQLHLIAAICLTDLARRKVKRK